MRRRAALAAVLLLLACGGAGAAAPVEIDALTSPEVRERIAAGATTVLLPVGGTEQSGAHLVLGKHNVRVRVLAGRIAQRLGDALVAPVLAYVPEGALAPPSGHMRWAGTISVDEAAFEALLASAARSLCVHGFRDVVILADHGGTQGAIAHAAQRAGRGAPAGCRVHALDAYYAAAQAPYVQALQVQGVAPGEIGTHGGLADTALALAVDPALVRSDRMVAAPRAGQGVDGDPRRATAALGQLGVERIVEQSVAAIRARLGANAAASAARTSR